MPVHGSPIHAGECQVQILRRPALHVVKHLVVVVAGHLRVEGVRKARIDRSLRVAVHEGGLDHIGVAFPDQRQVAGHADAAQVLRGLTILVADVALQIRPVAQPGQRLHGRVAFLKEVGAIPVRALVHAPRLAFRHKHILVVQVPHHVVGTRGRPILIAIGAEEQHVLRRAVRRLHCLQVRAFHQTQVLAAQCTRVQDRCALIGPGLAVAAGIDTDLVAFGQVHHQLAAGSVMPDVRVAVVRGGGRALQDRLPAVVGYIALAEVQRIGSVLMLPAFGIAREIRDDGCRRQILEEAAGVVDHRARGHGRPAMRELRNGHALVLEMLPVPGPDVVPLGAVVVGLVVAVQQVIQVEVAICPLEEGLDVVHETGRRVVVVDLLVLRTGRRSRHHGCWLRQCQHPCHHTHGSKNVSVFQHHRFPLYRLESGPRLSPRGCRLQR